MNFKIEYGARHAPKQEKEAKPLVVEQRKGVVESPRSERKPKIEVQKEKPVVLPHEESIDDGRMKGIIHEEPVVPRYERDPKMVERDQILRDVKKPEEEEPKGFISKLANSRFIKPAAALFAFSGVAGTIGTGYEAMSRSFGERADQYEKAADIVLQSPTDALKEHGFTFDNLPKDSDIIRFGDGTEATRQEVKLKTNIWYTNQIRDHSSSLELLSKTCGKKQANGNILLDAHTCNALYGDQEALSLDEKGLATLSFATGYSVQELALEGKILRHSVVISDKMEAGGSGSVTGVSVYDGNRLPGDFLPHEKTLFASKLAFAQQTAMHIIKSLDLTHDDHALEKVKAIQEALKAEITLSNDEILIASDIANLTNAQIRETLIPSAGGNGHLDLARAHEGMAELSWKKVAAYEKDRSGPLHAFTHTLEDVRNDRLAALLKTGYEAGIDRDFFSAALEDHEKSPELAMK